MANIVKRGGGVAPSWQKALERAGGRKLETAEKRGPVAVPGTVILAIDCSSSMARDKLRQAQAGALAFAKDALGRGYAIGIVQFDSEAYVRAPPGREIGALHAAVETRAVSGTTNLADGLRLAAEQVGARPNSVICIVTDGVPDSPSAAMQAAADAKGRGIDIMAVGTDDADWDYLSRLVTRTELAAKVEANRLGQQIADMSKKLPLLGAPPTAKGDD